MKRYPHNPNCKCLKSEKARKDWWVDAPEYDNCVFTYLRHNERAHTLFEIATLMNLSISAVTSIEKKALIKLRKRLKRLNIAHTS